MSYNDSQNADEILTQLSDNEINWRISCDAGYKAEIGDDVNGFSVGAQCFATLLEAAQWLMEQAVEYYLHLGIEQKTCFTCGQGTFKYQMIINTVIQPPGVLICNQCVEKHNSLMLDG